jgi:hypothetical protein
MIVGTPGGNAQGGPRLGQYSSSSTIIPAGGSSGRRRRTLGDVMAFVFEPHRSRPPRSCGRKSSRWRSFAEQVARNTIFDRQIADADILDARDPVGSHARFAFVDAVVVSVRVVVGVGGVPVVGSAVDDRLVNPMDDLTHQGDEAVVEVLDVWFRVRAGWRPMSGRILAGEDGGAPVVQAVLGRGGARLAGKTDWRVVRRRVWAVGRSRWDRNGRQWHRDEQEHDQPGLQFRSHRCHQLE